MQKTKFNYFLGNQKESWHANVSTFSRIYYEDIYPGIDLLFYGDNNNLKYEFIVFGDPSSIRFSYEGQEKLYVTDTGDLIISTPIGELIERKPYTYQIIEGAKKEIECNFKIEDKTASFEIGDYDKSEPLVIDPLIYSTYIGGSGDDRGHSIAVDSEGNAYVTGYTYSTNFPVTAGAYQSTNAGSADVFVTKLNSSGEALLYSTYIGGSDEDSAQGIFIDSEGNAYVTGNTFSNNFPITLGAYQSSKSINYDDVFIIKLNSSGESLLYSTYIGGSFFDVGEDIAVDSAGNAYVTGYTYSTNFPTSAEGFQTSNAGSSDIFVFKMNPFGQALLYSTYIGGSDYDYGESIAVDSAGNAYVTGRIESSNFPTSLNAFQSLYGGGFTDAFLTKLNSSGQALLYSTYLGGSGTDYGESIIIDSNQNSCITGHTFSTNFPVTAGAYQSTNAGSADVFVTKLNSSGEALLYSTYIGGSGGDYGESISKDSNGNYLITGYTHSTNFPVTAGAYQSTNAGSADVFVTKLNSSGEALLYSTYIGGSNNDVGESLAVDSAGNAYVTGRIESSNFPTSVNAYQSNNRGIIDGIILKITPIAKAKIISSILASPPNVKKGDIINVNMSVQNIGQENINNLAPSSLTLGGKGKVNILSGPNPPQVTIDGGTGKSFSWTFLADESGIINFSGNASGTALLSGEHVFSEYIVSNNLKILGPASIISSIVAYPLQVEKGNLVTVVMTVKNEGDEIAYNVIPSPLIIDGNGSVNLFSNVYPAFVDILDHSEANFIWKYQALEIGFISFKGNSIGNSSIISPETISNTVIIIPPNQNLDSNISKTSKLSPETISLEVGSIEIDGNEISSSLFINPGLNTFDITINNTGSLASIAYLKIGLPDGITLIGIEPEKEIIQTDGSETFSINLDASEMPEGEYKIILEIHSIGTIEYKEITITVKNNNSQK